MRGLDGDGRRRAVMGGDSKVDLVAGGFFAGGVDEVRALGDVGF